MTDKRRRGSGEGAVYKAPDGRWRGAVDLGWQDGRRIRKYVSAGTRNEALAKLRDLQRNIEQGVNADARMTVEAWLNHWLATVVDGRVGSENTRSNYRQIVRVHLVPGLGKVRLDKLTAEQVDRFLAGKADAGLSRSHIGRMRTILADALRHAERRGLIPRNAAALSVMPKTKAPAPRRSLTPDEARALAAAAAGERLEALVVVGLVAGLRPGELAGLTWPDIDLEGDSPTLTVSGSLKRTPAPDGKGYQLALGAVKRSTNGRRTVELPKVAGEALRAHRARQAAERLQAGPLWEDHGLVFCSEIGTPLDPSNIRRTFARIARKAGLDAGFPYLLRHTAASLLIDAGAG
ncbi:MAG TPA: tyrosine-type recombinase/integrase, partial [Mycobacteriales bacterium]|nr:tyrosine-type recombinase/integrase [Mycobacteriales bacterium]